MGLGALAPRVWGWRAKPVQDKYDSDFCGYLPQGERISWIQGEDLYLNPDASCGVAQGASPMDGLTVSPKTLCK